MLLNFCTRSISGNYRYCDERMSWKNIQPCCGDKIIDENIEIRETHVN